MSNSWDTVLVVWQALDKWLPKIRLSCLLCFDKILPYLPFLRWEATLNKAVEHCRKNNITCGKLETALWE